METEVGTYSGALEEKQYGYKPRSRVYAGKNWGWQTEESYKKTVQKRKGAVFYNSIQSIADRLKQFAAPVVQAAAPVLDAVGGIVQSSPLGQLSEQTELATEYLEKQAVQQGFDARVGTSSALLIEEAATAGLGKGLGSVAKGIKNLPPPPKPMAVAAGGSMSLQSPQIQLPNIGGQVLELSVDEAPRGLARPRGQRGDNRVVTSSDRKVESLIADNVSTDELKNRPKNTALATNYDISDQDLFQGRYGKSRDAASQAHHALDQDLFGRAFEGPEGADVRNIANKNMLRFGNDAFNMADVPGYIVGSDHQAYFHGKIYRQLPSRKALDSAIKDGSYFRYSPKYRANLVIAAAKESQQSVLKWAKWKLNLMESKYPAMKKMNSKQKRMFVESLKEEFQAIGAGQQPSMEELMSGRTAHLNDDLREVFGIQFGSKPSNKSHPIPAKYRRRSSGKISYY